MELLVTVAIVGILSSISVANYHAFKESAYTAEMVLTQRDMIQAAHYVADSCTFAPNSWAQAGRRNLNGTTTTYGSPGYDTCSDDILDVLPHLNNSTKFGWWTSLVTVNQQTMFSGGATWAIEARVVHCGIQSGDANNHLGHWNETYVAPKPELVMDLDYYWAGFVTTYCTNY